jgi:hypothetical protein
VECGEEGMESGIVFLNILIRCERLWMCLGSKFCAHCGDKFLWNLNFISSYKTMDYISMIFVVKFSAVVRELL